MGGSGGATAESFLFPLIPGILIPGISIVTFVLTATVTLSPTEAEMRSERDLMDRINQLRAEARLAVPAGSRPQ